MHTYVKVTLLFDVFLPMNMLKMKKKKIRRRLRQEESKEKYGADIEADRNEGQGRNEGKLRLSCHICSPTHGLAVTQQRSMVPPRRDKSRDGWMKMDEEVGR